MYNNTAYKPGISDDYDFGRNGPRVSMDSLSIEQARRAVEAAKVTLASNMASKMKPGDVVYAKKLIKESATRTITTKEWVWLEEFVKWYDAMNPKFWDWWESGGSDETLRLQKEAASPIASVASKTRAAVKSVASAIAGTSRYKSPSDTDMLDAPPQPTSNYLVAICVFGGLGALSYAGYRMLSKKGRSSKVPSSSLKDEGGAGSELPPRKGGRRYLVFVPNNKFVWDFAGSGPSPKFHSLDEVVTHLRWGWDREDAENLKASDFTKKADGYYYEGERVLAIASSTRSTR